MTLASLLAVVGVGVGGNMPVDSAVFLGMIASLVNGHTAKSLTDLIPGTHQYLLTVLSIWWCLGQLLISLVRNHPFEFYDLTGIPPFSLPGLLLPTSPAQLPPPNVPEAKIWGGVIYCLRLAV